MKNEFYTMFCANKLLLLSIIIYDVVYKRRYLLSIVHYHHVTTCGKISEMY